ncbi:MAG: acyl carrier protein [Deltaproteobacteria bacterium CG11_big_fil_rev_8_21_14_0_20_47_16]|nr:MAG: acyl carrier protein [Deltaproteobacteria bacterium CG11_big_fil_rev_8_21_14_0_20_47_16]
MDDIEEILRTTIAEQLGIGEDEIAPSSTFGGDLGADSLDILELILAMEEHLEIDLPDEDMKKLKTVQEWIDYLNHRLSS